MTAKGELIAVDAATGKEAWRCIISPDNAASLRVAARLGYHEIGRADFKGEPILVFEQRAA